MQNLHIPSKSALELKKVYYKVSLCEYYQRPSLTAFKGLSTCAKMIGGRYPFYLKVWPKLACPLQKHRFTINICS